MLSIEIIVVLGFLYCLFMFGILRAKRAQERAREVKKAKEVPLAQEKIAEEKSLSR